MAIRSSCLCQAIERNKPVLGTSREGMVAFLVKILQQARLYMLYILFLFFSQDALRLQIILDSQQLSLFAFAMLGNL